MGLLLVLQSVRALVQTLVLQDPEHLQAPEPLQAPKQPSSSPQALNPRVALIPSIQQRLCNHAVKPLMESPYITTSQKGDVLGVLSRLKIEVDLSFAKVRSYRCNFLSQHLAQYIHSLSLAVRYPDAATGGLALGGTPQRHV